MCYIEFRGTNPSTLLFFCFSAQHNQPVAVLDVALYSSLVCSSPFWLAPHSTDYMFCVAGPALVAGTACLCMERPRLYMCVGVGVGVGMGVDVGLGWR